MWDLFIVSPFFKFLARLWALLLTPIVLLSGVSASVIQLAGEDAIQATGLGPWIPWDRPAGIRTAKVELALAPGDGRFITVG